jgi:diaminohydroxyphosphoribosylaminopyrimidine deaminase / 5-amino-6-(5-phosphoribosylamino)uracil reductase
VEACAKAEVDYRDAILYVTLEPCCHWGRTPPCTELIVNKGIKAVYFGYEDPNPVVAGGGKKWLQERGIICERLEHPDITQFYQSYQHWFSTQKPWVISKLAMSIDGKIADAASRPVNITGPEAAHYTHIGRKHADAILTTLKTIVQDDPQLNVRLDGTIMSKPLYVLDSNLNFPLKARVLQSSHSITLFHSTDDQHKISTLTEVGVHCCHVNTGPEGLQLDEVLTYIGSDGIHELWVEAGGKLFSALAREGLTHKSYIYIAPKVLGQESLAAFDHNNVLNRAKQVSWSTLGQDSVCEILW